MSRRLFTFIAAIVLLDTMFYAALSPLLPEFEEDFGLSKSAAGLLSASYAAGTLLAAVPAAWVALRWGVRFTMFVSIVVIGVSSLGFAVTDDLSLLYVSRFVQGVGGAFMWTAAMVWLVNATPQENRGLVIGSALAASVTGTLLGPLLGTAAVEFGRGPVFAGVAAVLFALGAWGTTFPAPPASRDVDLGVARSRLGSADITIPLWLVTVPALLSGALTALAPLELAEFGASGVTIGGIFFGVAVVEAVAGRLSGAASDQRGRRTPIRIGLLVAIAGAIALPLPDEAVVFGGLLMFATAGLGAALAPAIALLSDSAERIGIDQIVAFCLANIAWAGGQFLGGGGAGRLADSFGDAVPFFLLAALLAVGLALTPRVAERQSA